MGVRGGRTLGTGMDTCAPPESGLGTSLFLCRYNSLSILPAALGKPVRDVASKAKAVGIHGNLSGDLLQSGGLLVVSKGGSGKT